ncbi:hypothetical protein L209DRAFT_613168 [Thermothelomyces heterothallicus CBS 203.75]
MSVLDTQQWKLSVWSQGSLVQGLCLHYCLSMLLATLSNLVPPTWQPGSVPHQGHTTSSLQPSDLGHTHRHCGSGRPATFSISLSSHLA